MKREEEITITIAGKGYKLTIDPLKRELYKLAEQRVRAAMVKFERENFAEFRTEDAVALTAFEFAIANIKLHQQSELESEEVATLRKIESSISDYLNDINIEKRD